MTRRTYHPVLYELYTDAPTQRHFLSIVIISDHHKNHMSLDKQILIDSQRFLQNRFNTLKKSIPQDL